MGFPGRGMLWDGLILSLPWLSAFGRICELDVVI
jgi:hypothetical protein